jgi:hypothetical protein
MNEAKEVNNCGIEVQTLGGEVLILARVLLFDNLEFV